MKDAHVLAVSAASVAVKPVNHAAVAGCCSASFVLLKHGCVVDVGSIVIHMCGRNYYYIII
jgi:hypothetical protein